MIRFIVIDCQESLSWVNDSMEDVKISMGYEKEDNWEEIRSKVNGEYEVIKIDSDYNFTLEYLI